VEFRPTLKPSQKIAIYPQAILAQRLLSLPHCTLRQEIQREIEENPALELTEEWFASNGHEVHSPAAHKGPGRGEQAEDRQDPGEMTAKVTLQQHLWEGLALEVSDSLIRRIAHYLIDNLNDDGYLCCEIQEVALHFGTEEAKIEEVLRLVQGLEPPGVGARDLRECLLIQIGRLRGQGLHPHAEEPALSVYPERSRREAEGILREHWEEFARRRFDLIAKKMKVPLRQVQEVAGFIRARLHPYPGRGFRLPWQSSEAPELPRPDVIIRRNGDRQVEIAEDSLPLVRLSPAYSQIYQQMRTNGVCCTEEEKKHVTALVRRARLFLEALEQRTRTLKRIASLIAFLEEGFLQRGEQGLVPLSRGDLARRLGFSLSTISRALANKYLLTPAGEVVSFDIFFDESVLAKEMIRRFVEREEKGKPLSDGEIARRLAGQGIRLARRTVAKYREELKILSRSKRSG